MSTSSHPPTLGSFTKSGPNDWARDVLLVYHPFRDVPFLVIPIRVCHLADGTHSRSACIPLTAVLDACFVVTGRDGELALDRAGQQVVHTDLATAQSYYYIVGGNSTLNYPLFYYFDEWVPPRREEVPERWFTPVFPRSRTMIRLHRDRA